VNSIPGGYDLVAMGRCCLDETCLISSGSLENRKNPILERRISGGGQAATSAVTVSLLGGKAAFIGNLGRDSPGEMILKEFHDFGVDTRWIQRPENYKTPKAIILVDERNGERTIFYEPGSSSHSLRLPIEILKTARCLILDPEISTEDLEEIIKNKAKKTLIVYDGERQRPSLSAMMEHADFFIASETILDLEPTQGRFKVFEELRSKIQGEFMITFGECGSIWVQDHEILHIPAWRGVKTIDTTGAGDVFHAAFAFFYLQDGEIVSAMKKASFCAARSTESLGNRNPVALTQGLTKALDELQETPLSNSKLQAMML